MDHPVLAPTFALVGLTAAVWLWMYAVRLHFIARQRINPQTLATREAARQTLAGANKPADNFNNLLEVPVLYYALVALLVAGGVTDPRMTQLAWGYVLLRAVHSAIHLTYNRVVHRFAAYVASCVILGAMWMRLAGYYVSVQ
jgi:hypothetical protein